MKDQFQIKNIFLKPPHPPSNPPVSPLSRHYSIFSILAYASHSPTSRTIRSRLVGRSSAGRRYSVFFWPLRGLKWLIIGGSPRVRLSGGELDKKRRRLAVSVGVILLIILIITGILGLYRRREIIRKNQLKQIEERVEWVISQAEQMSAISAGRAGKIVEEERLSVEAKLKQTKDKKLAVSFNQIISDLIEVERRVSRVESAIPELYLSLGLIRPDTSGRVVSDGQNTMGILSDDNVVLLVSMSGRSGEAVGGGELIKQGIELAVSEDPAKGRSAFGGKTFVLNPDNIVEIDNKNKTSAVVVGDEEDVWQNPTLLSVFGGSLFVFDKSSSEIYKYSAVESGGYGSRRRWLAPGVAPNLIDIVDMEIDGDIWLLHQDGRLDKFRRGAGAGFKQSGLPDGLVLPQAISVPVGGGKVWVLDASSRVVAFDKESGDYAGQWQFSDIGADDLAVSESLGKIFLLSGENIYVFDF